MQQFAENVFRNEIKYCVASRQRRCAETTRGVKLSKTRNDERKENVQHRDGFDVFCLRSKNKIFTTRARTLSRSFQLFTPNEFQKKKKYIPESRQLTRVVYRPTTTYRYLIVFAQSEPMVGYSFVGFKLRRQKSGRRLIRAVENSTVVCD